MPLAARLKLERDRPMLGAVGDRGSERSWAVSDPPFGMDATTFRLGRRSRRLPTAVLGFLSMRSARLRVAASPLYMLLVGCILVGYCGCGPTRFCLNTSLDMPPNIDVESRRRGMARDPCAADRLAMSPVETFPFKLPEPLNSAVVFAACWPTDCWLWFTASPEKFRPSKEEAAMHFWEATE